MSVNTPPTENIPIFDPSVFPSASGTALTIASGSKYFLTYPVAQGSEIFPSNVTLQSTLTDSSGDVGTTGQVLSSTGTGTNWVANSSNNNTINYNTSALPFTLPIPTQANTYYTFTGTTPAGGILTIPISGITTGTYIYIKNASGTVGINISTTYIKFQGSTTTTTLRSVQTGKGIALYFNGSYWIETQFTDFAENIFISNTTSTGTLATNSLTKSFSYGAGDPMVIWNDVTQSDISIGNTLPAPYTVRIANTTSGSSGGSVHCANVGFDGSHINNATDPTGASGGNLKLGQLLTSGPLYIGGGANTAVHTTGPIIIGSDSTASGGINIGTGTNQTVPTVNTVNIGSGTYATNIKGTLSTFGITSASGNITATTGNISASAGSVSASTTITAGTDITATTGNITASAGSVSTTSGSITSAGVITGTSIIAPSFNASTNTDTVGISTTQTSGVLNIGTGARVLTGSGGAINIGTGSGATANPINIGGAGTQTTVNGHLNITLLSTTGGASTTGTLSGKVSIELGNGTKTLPVTTGGINLDYYYISNSTNISTLTLPPVLVNQRVNIKHNGTGASLNISRSGSSLIFGSGASTGTTSITGITTSVRLICDGTNWYAF